MSAPGSMQGLALRLEGIGKRYQLGGRQPYGTLRDTVVDAVRRPWGRGRPAEPPALWALRGVSFEVREGEVVGIIGRNGAGKSTLLKILSRIAEPTEGQAWTRGRVRALLEVGTGFHAELSGRENIYLNGAILGMRRAEIEKRFDEIVAFAEVERFLDTPVKHYSSGMYVRLAFAVAAHLEPEILLVDEVLAVGDAAFQRKCLGKLNEAARFGRTVLFVSHNMAAIRSLCSRCLLIDAGGLALDGDPDTCIARYLAEAGAALPATIDTHDLPRPAVVADERALRITRVTLGGAAAAVAWAGKPLELRIEFDCHEPLDDVVIAWSVHSAENVRLFECRTGDDYGPIARLEPGAWAVTCRIGANPLNPGLFSLHVGARCARKGLDYLPAVMMLQVDLPEALASWWLEAPSGLLRVPSSWSPPEPRVAAAVEMQRA